jgi:hypothetical protein
MLPLAANTVQEVILYGYVSITATLLMKERIQGLFAPLPWANGTG